MFRRGPTPFGGHREDPPAPLSLSSGSVRLLGIVEHIRTPLVKRAGALREDAAQRSDVMMPSAEISHFSREFRVNISLPSVEFQWTLG